MIPPLDLPPGYFGDPVQLSGVGFDTEEERAAALARLPDDARTTWRVLAEQLIAGTRRATRAELDAWLDAIVTLEDFSRACDDSGLWP